MQTKIQTDIFLNQVTFLKKFTLTAFKPFFWLLFGMITACAYVAPTSAEVLDPAPSQESQVTGNTSSGNEASLSPTPTGDSPGETSEDATEIPPASPSESQTSASEGASVDSKIESDNTSGEAGAGDEAPENVPVVEEVTASESIEAQEDYSADYQLYKKYLLFQKFEKKQLYQKYARYQQLAGKYPWEASKKTEKKILKKLKNDYKKSKKKKYRKNPAKYAGIFERANDYRNYKGMKAEYFSLKPYAGYGEYSRFNRDEYNGYSTYGNAEYKAGYDRYVGLMAQGKVTDRGDADIESGSLGPQMTVGIFNYVPRDLKESAAKIEADQSFQIVDREGAVLAVIPADTEIKVKYDGDKKYRIYYSESEELIGKPYKEVRFEGTAETKESIIFDINRPGSSFDQYRGSLRLRYYDSPASDGDRIWVINALPLEHYVWGMGEITGTGPEQYNRVMTTIFRTYGYWKIKWSTKYADQGFKVDATPGNQLYYGYDYEKTHGPIRAAAEATRGKLVMYDRELALTPYSSWTDGATRRFEDGHWGRSCKTERSKKSELYPWLSAVTDSRGKNESRNTCELAATGNHMVGLSANGAVQMAKHDGASYENILEHFYAGIDLVGGY